MKIGIKNRNPWYTWSELSIEDGQTKIEVDVYDDEVDSLSSELFETIMELNRHREDSVQIIMDLVKQHYSNVVIRQTL